MRYLLATILFLSLSGCSLFKEKTGAFVSEAVIGHIAEAVDAKLERRNLSLREIKSVTDLNNDGRVDMSEIRETARLAAGEIAASQTQKWEQLSREKWKVASDNFVTVDSQTTFKSKIADFWNYLLATIGALVTAIGSYLTKQVFSAKSDGKRDVEIAKGAARQDMLEKMLGRDLDGDGDVGGVPTAEV